MEPPKTREEFLARFEKAKERRRIMIKNMKENLKEEYYKEHGVWLKDEDITVW